MNERLRSDSCHWNERGYGLMAMVDRRTGRFLGRTGLKHWPQFDETEVGWVLHRDFWGRGLATEAARACLQWGFRTLELPYLTALIEPSNVRSIRVAERLGMAPARHELLFDRDMIVYSISRERRAPADAAARLTGQVP